MLYGKYFEHVLVTQLYSKILLFSGQNTFPFKHSSNYVKTLQDLKSSYCFLTNSLLCQHPFPIFEKKSPKSIPHLCSIILKCFRIVCLLLLKKSSMKMKMLSVFWSFVIPFMKMLNKKRPGIAGFQSSVKCRSLEQLKTFCQFGHQSSHSHTLKSTTKKDVSRFCTLFLTHLFLFL